MKSPSRLQPLALALIASCVIVGASHAADAPTVLVRSGGVTVDEFAEMNRQARDFSMKLVLASKGSGAYLADVDVLVRSLPARQIMIDQRSEGPLLLATLPPGRYEVTASFGDVRPGAPTSIRRIVTVPRRGLAQEVFYFDTGDNVSEDSPAVYSTR